MKHYEAIVIGAGVAGLYQIKRLADLGIEATVLEAGGDLGGTWYWNRYPGARCDVESVLYSYSFSPEIEQEWRWSERYAAQPEILAYLRFVADRLDLRKDIEFGRRVESAEFDETRAGWTIDVDDGRRHFAKFCILATGPLSVGRLPDIPGIADFKGESYHTGRWPEHEVDFTGKRVGVIGTGSSGTQVIPTVAPQAERLYAFVRTPNFTVPARNHPLTVEQQEYWQSNRATQRRFHFDGKTSGAGDAFFTEAEWSQQQQDAFAFSPEERRAILDSRWDIGGGSPVMGAFRNVMVDERVNTLLAEYVRERVRQTVEDPQTAQSLNPADFPIGARRLCIDTGFYEAFNRENVELVDVRREPIVAMSASGVKTSEREIELDAIIFATGFDAMTGAILAIDIVGHDGLRMSEAWAHGPVNYLGLAINGFPNLFMIGGPGSPSALSNVVASNERHVDFLSDLLAYMRERGFDLVEASQDAQETWVTHCREAADRTLFSRADSWYVGSNVPGKPRVVMPYVGGFVAYGQKLAEVEENHFEGFAFESVTSKAFAETD